LPEEATHGHRPRRTTRGSGQGGDVQAFRRFGRQRRASRCHRTVHQPMARRCAG
jgi:hypothetical protein